jgi:uncharacterized protein YecE (DUF72 family)
VREWLAWYARHFDSVELNTTFYHLPQSHVFTGWRARVPSGFRFALKFNRYGTHIKRLKEPGPIILRFLSRAKRLERMLGPILVQLPPRFKADPDRLDRFLAAAPGRLRWALSTPVGSAANAECRIDSISQSWAVLSGAGRSRPRGVGDHARRRSP